VVDRNHRTVDRLPTLDDLEVFPSASIQTHGLVLLVAILLCPWSCCIGQLVVSYLGFLVVVAYTERELRTILMGRVV
jgi:hypothetical protein